MHAKMINLHISVECGFIIAGSPTAAAGGPTAEDVRSIDSKLSALYLNLFKVLSSYGFCVRGLGSDE